MSPRRGRCLARSGSVAAGRARRVSLQRPGTNHAGAVPHVRGMSRHLPPDEGVTDSPTRCERDGMRLPAVAASYRGAGSPGDGADDEGDRRAGATPVIRRRGGGVVAGRRRTGGTRRRRRVSEQGVAWQRPGSPCGSVPWAGVCGTRSRPDLPGAGGSRISIDHLSVVATRHDHSRAGRWVRPRRQRDASRRSVTGWLRWCGQCRRRSRRTSCRCRSLRTGWSSHRRRRRSGRAGSPAVPARSRSARRLPVA